MVTNGALFGQRFEVKPGGVRLGRSSSNDIQIPDEELSRNHCLFEPVGEAGIRLTDLASANGTVLNGQVIGAEPVELYEGDVVEVGKTIIRVGEVSESDPTVRAGRVDLGLGTASAEGAEAVGPQPVVAPRRSPLANVLWAVATVLALAAGVVMWLLPQKQEESTSPVPLVEEKPVLREMSYEKVEADAGRIFRYELTLSPDGAFSVRMDDVPEANRHVTKGHPLSPEALQELGEVLSFAGLKDLDREYAGPEPDPPALTSWTLSVVYSTRARTIRVVNTQEPEAFRAVRERLEAFAKSELGIWAIQYPREKLIELAGEALELGNAKWDDRDVNHGNLAAAIEAYRESLFYLDTVNPKPECAKAAQDGLERATVELEKRYADQRFAADRALNLAHWEEARTQLQILLEMVPDRRDPRNRDAREKFMSAEKHLKKGGK